MDAAALRRLRSRFAFPILAALLLAGSAGPARAESAARLPYIVKVYADWCGTCAALEPTWHKIEQEYRGKARLVVFDVTNRKTLEQARTTAELLGLQRVLEEYKSKTGTIAVLDAYRNTVAVLSGELDFAAYKAAIARADLS